MYQNGKVPREALEKCADTTTQLFGQSVLYVLFINFHFDNKDKHTAEAQTFALYIQLHSNKIY